MAKRLRKKIQGYDMDDLPLLGIQFSQKKEAIKELNNQCTQLRVPLEEALEVSGRVDDKGSRLLVLPHADVDVHLKHSRRVSVSLVDNAEDILRDNKLDDCIKTVTTTEIDEAQLQHLYELGDVSKEVIASLYTSKEIYAFSVDVKEAFRE